MTAAQEDHLQSIKDNFISLVDTKYRAGVIEHGGNLFDAPAEKLMGEALNETIDQFTYIITLRDNYFKRVRELLVIIGKQAEEIKELKSAVLNR